MFDPFKRNSNAGASKKVKGWVRNTLDLSDEHTILVTELQCTEPGCPPLETVVAVLEPGGQQHQKKVHRAMSEITENEAKELALELQKVMAGTNTDEKENCDGHH